MRLPVSKRIPNWIALIYRHRFLVSLVTVILISVLVYILANAAQNVRYLYGYVVFLPLVISGLALGVRWGAFMGALAGVMLAPLLAIIDPLDGTFVMVVDAILRLVLFAGVGAFSGYVATRLRASSRTIHQLRTRNQLTDIPDINALRFFTPKINHTYTLTSVLIGNKQSIVDMLGIGVYRDLLRKLYDVLIDNLGKKGFVVQSDSDKFWIAMPSSGLEKDVEDLQAVLDNEWDVHGIPLYVAIHLGAEAKTPSESRFYATDFNTPTARSNIAFKLRTFYIIRDLELDKQQEDYELLSGFSSALENDELYITFQPQLSPEGATLVGLEALVRWQHPEKGKISPGRFIPLIEKTELIHTFTEWLLQRVLTVIDAFPNQWDDVYFSINVSAKNIYDGKFLERLPKALETKGIAPSRLKVELTETALMQNPEAAKRQLSTLQSHGIGTAIDDFGKGHSSLYYLGAFEADTLKVDQHFIWKMMDDERVYSIVRAAVRLAKDLGMRVVAEGVEDETMLQTVDELGFDGVQGYYFAKPMEFRALKHWLRSQASPQLMDAESYLRGEM